MKKKLMIMLSIMIVLLFTACGGGGSDNNATEQPDTGETEKPDTGEIEKSDNNSDKVYADKNGFEFKIIKSKKTDRKWLDRNMGASRACEEIVGINKSVTTDDANESATTDDANESATTDDANESATTDDANESATTDGTDESAITDDANESATYTNLADSECFGDYYQWGRATNDHENATRNPTLVKVNNLDADIGSGQQFVRNTEKMTADDKKNHFYSDWADTDSTGFKRKENWTSSDGNIICPIGFRVPTKQELFDEFNDENVSIENNQLKVPIAGFRTSDAKMAYLVNPKKGFLWSTDTEKGNSFAYSLMLSEHDQTKTWHFFRIYGMPVRCTSRNTSPEAVIDLNVSENIRADEITTVELNALNSKDKDIGDKEILTFSWSLKYAPEGSKAKIENNTSSVTTFTPDLPGGYVVSLVVKDTEYFSKPHLVSITKGWEESVEGTDYKRVISPHTGKTWLDRNLGASKVCETLDDELCFGDYYQWGRATNGHEKVIEESTLVKVNNLDADIGSGQQFVRNTEKMTADDKKNHFYSDWADTNASVNINTDSTGFKRKENWTSTDGNIICPVGYRVPTKLELYAETKTKDGRISSKSDIEDNFLKIPIAGFRTSDAKMAYLVNPKKGFLWSTDTEKGNSFAYSLMLSEHDQAKTWHFFRIYGMPVRCMQSDKKKL